MTINEMHYDFKQKLNKIDSQQYRNLRVPEIDWKLNEAIELYIKMIAQPKVRNNFGFEISQRVTDDIRTIVKNSVPLVVSLIPNTTEYLAVLPTDYAHFISVNNLKIKNGNCTVSAEKVNKIEHDDNSNGSAFDKPSFEWREANIRFFDGGIKIFTGGEFTVTSFSINYIRKHRIVHNAVNFPGGTYTDLKGVVLTGSLDCELPDDTHREIVDLAVAITSGDLQIPDYQIKRSKLNLNQIT